MAATSLVGRDDAIAVVRARLRDITDRGGALIVRGAAGIGKTSLLDIAVNDARSRKHVVLATAGVDSEAHLPYAGLHQLLRPVLGRADGLPRPPRDALLTAFGMLDGPPPELFLVGLAVLTLLTGVRKVVKCWSRVGRPRDSELERPLWGDRPSAQRRRRPCPSAWMTATTSRTRA